MDSALKTMIANMPEKTGKSLEEWHKVLSKQGFEKHGQAVKFLKAEHAVSHGFANTIVALFFQKDSSAEDLVEAQYKGKESLYPIYLALIDFVKTLGAEVNIVPKKTSVSIVRKRQFILIKPATKSRIDLGFKFNNRPNGERLGDSGPFGTMCSHRVILQGLEEVDDELKTWIREAFEEA
jgi:hypothetical protein